MQVVIALPRVEEIERLEKPICGVPLLVRVISTALRSGGGNVLLVRPPGWPQRRLSVLLRPIESDWIEIVDAAGPFDPNESENWRAIAHCLEDRFLWMPYDYLAHKAALTTLLAAAEIHPDAAVRFSGTAEAGSDRSIFDRPTVLVRADQLEGAPAHFEVVTVQARRGVSARPPAKLRDVEAELVRRTGKVTDGIYSRFNRWLSRPAVRWLSHTCITPNTVSFIGLGVSLLAGLCFAQGTWAWDIAGAAVFFMSGLVDEMDGMLARLKFQESAFGCWLETMADYSSYVLIFAGMTVGGYRHGGSLYLVMGAALLFGCLLSFVVISIQRKLAAPPDAPNEYARRYLAALDRDSGNPVSRIVRQLQFLTKKGVLIHYLLLFAVVGVLPVAMFLSAVAANIAWVVTIYLNFRLFSSRRQRAGVVSGRRAPVEVGK
jgi:phosphatidylglycerophosphate synthase